MTVQLVEHQEVPPAANPTAVLEPWTERGFSSGECCLNVEACPVDRLMASLGREAVLLRQKDLLLQEQEVLRRETDHRLMNGLQMVASLLSLQSRTATNPEVAQQLALAANRVATIERVHKRLHLLDGTQAVAFKEYLEDLCRDVAGLIAADERLERAVSVESIALNLRTITAIPLGFIANELITNAAKHGDGRIELRLAAGAAGGYAMSVSNDGPRLPPAFDPGASKGLGMKLVQSFVRQIGGTLRFGVGDEGRGARFAVEFSLPGESPLAGEVSSGQ